MESAIHTHFQGHSFWVISGLYGTIWILKSPGTEFLGLSNDKFVHMRNKIKKSHKNYFLNNLDQWNSHGHSEPKWPIRIFYTLSKDL